MKITTEHFAYMKDRIEETLRNTPTAIDRYETGQFARSELVRDLWFRFRWDVARFALTSQWISDNLYPYLADEHIDTALRRLVPEVTRRF